MKFPFSQTFGLLALAAISLTSCTKRYETHLASLDASTMQMSDTLNEQNKNLTTIAESLKALEILASFPEDFINVVLAFLTEPVEPGETPNIEEILGENEDPEIELPTENE